MKTEASKRIDPERLAEFDTQDGEMTANIRVSVCMAVQNGEDFLREQLSSIITQLSAQDEIVIVNDGSTDATVATIRAMGDARIRLVDRQGRLGPKRAFEAALYEARGDFIFFSDADDIWMPGKLNRVLAEFQRADALAVVTDARVIDSDGRELLPSYFRWRGSGPGLLKNLWKNTFLGCCLAMRGDCKGYVLPFPRFVIMHDVWIGLASELVGRTAFVAEPLLLYRRHGSNHSRMERNAWPVILLRRLGLFIGLLQRLPWLMAWRLRLGRRSPAESNALSSTGV